MINIADYIYTNDGLVNVDELAHYGVPGMKWGKRMRTTTPLINKKLHKRKNMTPEELKVAQAKDNYVNAKKQYGRNMAKSSTLYGAWGPGNKERHERTYKSAVKATKAENAYKQAKTDLTKSRVKSYRDADKRANQLYNAGDKEMAKARELYKKTGKNTVSRIINNIKGNSAAVKAYSKQFNEAEIFNMADFILKGVKK